MMPGAEVGRQRAVGAGAHKQLGRHRLGAGGGERGWKGKGKPPPSLTYSTLTFKVFFARHCAECWGQRNE